jgi:hypothetical protein
MTIVVGRFCLKHRSLESCVLREFPSARWLFAGSSCEEIADMEVGPDLMLLSILKIEAKIQNRSMQR